jgi:HK97 family phage prohead protease
MSERKQVKFEVKSIDEEKGTFEGYASVFRQSQDKVGDIVMPGAFKKTINDHNGEIPLFWMHDIMSPVGLAKVEEDSHGLKVHGAFTRGVQKAEESYLFMKQGVIKSMSIGYDVVKKEIKNGVRYLQELKVPDISLVVGSFAADDMAVITAVKASESLDKRMQEISAAYRAATRTAPFQQMPENDSWLKEIFDDHVIVDKGGSLWQVPYTEKDNVITFDFVNVTEVEQVYQPKATEKALPVTEAVKDTSADDEAAEILKALKAVSIDFDPQAATKRVEELLAKL